VINFNLSAAFDTVGREDLLPKMSAIGIRGKALRWFRCYLSNAKQHVIWDGRVSNVAERSMGSGKGRCSGRCCTYCTTSTSPLSYRFILLRTVHQMFSTKPHTRNESGREGNLHY
jgi:hypothetical protein